MYERVDIPALSHCIATQVTLHGKRFDRSMTVRVGGVEVSGPPVLRTVLVNASAERIFPIDLTGANGRCVGHNHIGP